MTTEEIKRIIDDEQAEQLTVQLCRHWEVATKRLEGLVQELNDGMDTCVEAEIYAALMRMQSSVMALMELNKMPTACLFSEYLDRIAQTVSNASIRQSVMALTERLLGEKQASQQASFFDTIAQLQAQNAALPTAQQKAILQQVSPMQHFFAACAQHLKPEDLMMVASVIQNLNADGDDQKEVANYITDMRQKMDELQIMMGESLQMMLIWLLLLMLLPGQMVSLIQQSRTNSQAMARLFDKVLQRVRESSEWWNYWNDRRETLRVVSDSCSWKDIMTTERTKEREALALVRGGLFAKYTTDHETFEAEFLDAHLSDDDLRGFIFHLAALSEIARELNPTTKFGSEQLVNNELQSVGEAVLSAAQKLHQLVAEAWFSHYDAMWQELIQDEAIFARLKVTRNSPHNNLFTARFFCHLVGEMKKRAVFGAHSDNDLAEKLTTKKSAGTFRKNIQEGMGDEPENIRIIFNTIYQKHNALAHSKR